MKKSKDWMLQEKLDKSLEKGYDPDTLNDEDLKLYKLLYSKLEEVPDFSLSPDFADKVINKIDQKKTFPLLGERTLIIAVFIFILMITVVAFYLLGNRVSIVPVSQIFELKWFIALGVVIVAVIQFADQLLLRSKWSKYF